MRGLLSRGVWTPPDDRDGGHDSFGDFREDLSLG